ncbi:1-deoxy-D-xylulose 5-phosphate reductoisomerase [Desulfarculus baarsii DSM 2075]|uniref:1-deoxy-D-xylulose 5-phosphate reductoisomerase n=1 Tax=Desulfarculus baarsii (strain ATCC 33931 / DSM 2075 / LMG 7858 / VKM B-1802 / 2st14) TaxID=644282 RepID=E1QEY2_DESB2|nr:1-deoxy-D-xylulose-5-phosphate reductoisomerase [Desulfarculus baarsii]ADK84118.1 1-deoxy-D-xylulose 5-phosphate reductoisomerase [Desulfarculus baarsii DSM 2075]
MKKRLAILGSTGSIGQSTLDVVRRQAERFEIVSLTAASSVEALAAQAIEFRPKIVAVANQEAAGRLRALLPAGLRSLVAHGAEGYLEAAAGCGAQVVVSAMVGAAGLLPTLAAVKAGLTVALANKETLVAGGELVMAEAARGGATILPVDSEHSAIFQCLLAGAPEEVARLWLTASGGPFRQLDRQALAKVTPEQALAHPNWSMGPKITVDSATLMNKGLEVIEAHWLFDQPYDKIKVVVHPQSIVHSMVEFVDGNFMAQMGPPDMRLPIALALNHPRRLRAVGPSLDPGKLAALSFEEPDPERFPALGLACQAGRAGKAAPAVLNAANEVAVRRFLAGRLGFLDIASCVEAVLERHPGLPADSIGAILEADRWARAEARAWLDRRGS